MKITKTAINGLVVIKIEGSLITEQVRDFEKELYSSLENKDNVIIDFNELSFICSAGLSMLIAAHKKADVNGMMIVLTGCSEDIIKLFNLTALDKYLHISATIEEARSLISTR